MSVAGPGSSGAEYTRWLQATLNQVMNLQLPVDGVMSRQVRDAVRDFQRSRQLPADGFVGPDTERALIEARRGGASSPGAAPSPGEPAGAGGQDSPPNGHSDTAAPPSTDSEWEWAWELAAPARPRTVARRCDNRGLPAREQVRPVSQAKVRCAKVVFGQTDPHGVVARAAARAVQMLDNTIGELTNGRSRVCQGEPPAWPLLGDLTLTWLRDRLGVCVDDVRVWTAGTFVNRSVAEVIRRLTRVRNLIATNSLLYMCNGGGCNPGDPPVCDQDTWAFICRPDPCPPGTIRPIIHLCRSFWVPGVRDGRRVDPRVHAEFQAQTIIHEASHLYHCTTDAVGSTIGVAECLAQFVAVTNGSPIDSDFADRCRVTNRCGRPVAGEVGNLEVGAARPGAQRLRVVKTVFRPQNAIRLKGRPAVRR